MELELRVNTTVCQCRVERVVPVFSSRSFVVVLPRDLRYGWNIHGLKVSFHSREQDRKQRGGQGV